MTSSDDRELQEALEQVESHLQAARLENEQLRQEPETRRALEAQLALVREQLAQTQERQTHLHAALSRVQHPSALTASVTERLEAARVYEESRRPRASWIFVILAGLAMTALLALAWTAEGVDKGTLLGVGVFSAVMIVLIKNIGFRPGDW